MTAFDTQLRCNDCRKNCKGEDPYAPGALIEACASLSEVESNNLKPISAKRRSKEANKSALADTLAQDNEEDMEACEIDYSILHLKPDEQHPETRYISTGITTLA